jgi:hypothetical protein
MCVRVSDLARITTQFHCTFTDNDTRRFGHYIGSVERCSVSSGNGFVRTAVTAPAFSYLRPIEAGSERMVDQMFGSWNRLASWLRGIERVRAADISCDLARPDERGCVRLTVQTITLMGRV